MIPTIDLQRCFVLLILIAITVCLAITVHLYNPMLATGINSRTNFATTNVPWTPEELLFNLSSPDACTQPAEGFKAWNSGVVTVIKPEISRNCSKLFANDDSEIERAHKANQAWKNEVSDDEFLAKTGNCSWLRNELLDNLYNTVFEKNFPLAFVLVISKSPQQVFRFFKLLYRPQNTYCIHYDTKSEESFKKTFDNIARCFNNVKIASKLIKVAWGDHTILDAQMSCFSDLVKLRPSLPVHQQWKYAMNLCGTELPLATNREIVERLHSLKGSSAIHQSLVKNSNWEAWGRLRRLKLRNRKLPYGLKFYKGYTYNALSFEFAYYIVNDPFAKKVREFYSKADNSEEHFYSSLFMYPNVPGGYREELKKQYFSLIEAMWCFDKACESKCHGKMVHWVCICAAGDLPMILRTEKRAGNFFHNKYDQSMDNTVMDCLEERIVEKNQLEYQEECGNNRTNSTDHS